MTRAENQAETTAAVTISRLGAKGDGIADTPAGPLFVAYALPGETVRVGPVNSTAAGARAELVSITAPSPQRNDPYCALFTRCGGCTAQHMDDEVYSDWKRSNLVTALERAFNQIALPAVEPLVNAHGAGRRRVSFHGRIIDNKPAIGFMAPRTHSLIPIEHCPLLTEGLKQAPATALRLAQVLFARRKPLDFKITATTAGLDADIRGHGPANDDETRQLADAAMALDLARLSLHGERIIERRAAAVPMGKAMVTPPAGGFLQATDLGEETLARLVREACAAAPRKVKRAADLFAGCGPFALRLAEFAEVHAVEGDAPSLTALNAAFRSTAGLKKITTEVRDLFRRPLLPKELNQFDAVVFDPPRAGAEAQARQLALSEVPLVIGVSCDAATFARDARLLVDGGYTIQRITPVDQFRHSAHIETVGIFTRPPVAKRRR